MGSRKGLPLDTGGISLSSSLVIDWWLEFRESWLFWAPHADCNKRHWTNHKIFLLSLGTSSWHSWGSKEDCFLLELCSIVRCGFRGRGRERTELLAGEQTLEQTPSWKKKKKPWFTAFCMPPYLSLHITHSQVPDGEGVFLGVDLLCLTGPNNSSLLRATLKESTKWIWHPVPQVV